jgi:hypothetical protein
VPDTADELFDQWSGNDPLVEVGLEYPAVLLFVVWPRWNARRAMSDEARQVFARDRELRRR